MSIALASFRDQLIVVDQLIDIHRRLQTGRGRRHRQDALHAAGIVMTVAAWQAYVEKLLNEGLEKIGTDLNTPGTPRWAIHNFNMRRAAIKNAIKKFNTPNDVNVRSLFSDALDFDPWLSWEWNQNRRHWSVAEVRRRTNAWVLIRHSVAHGFELPGDVVWIQRNGRPRLTLGLLEECRRHFVHLAEKTDAGFGQFLVAHHQMPPPW